MTAERIKEIQMETAYPNSMSVQQALFKVWNECVQSEEAKKKIHKQQIKDAYFNGRYEADKIVMGHDFYAEQYYNETFK